MTARLRVEGLSKRYGDVVALDRVDLEVGAGEVCAIVGPNGCGKSTLLEIVEGLRPGDGGTVAIDGSLYPHRRSRGGVVGAQLQEESLPARIRVREALAFYASATDVPYPKDLVDLLGLEAVEEKRFVALSGGQKRRTILALAAVGQPRLALFDEPTAGLDPLGIDVVERLIEHLASRGAAVVLATHDLRQVSRVCDRALLLHQGTVTASGSLAEILAGVGATTVLELVRGDGVTDGVTDDLTDDVTDDVTDGVTASGPRSGALTPADLRHLGIVRSLDLDGTSLYFGADDLASRLRSWARYDGVVAGRVDLQMRGVTLLDAYLLALPEGAVESHRAAMADWRGGRA